MAEQASTASAAAPITLIEAITQALAYEIRNDPAVLVLGEDVGDNGGLVRATAGLSATFGPDRVLATPLGDSSIAGLTRPEGHTSEIPSLMRHSYQVMTST